MGTAYIVEYEDNLSIFYLAVLQRARGKWYGSMILDYVKEKVKGKNVNLDVEAVDDSADNISERLRRVEFYRRSGIVDTGYRLLDNMALSSDPQSSNPESFTRMWRHYSSVSLRKSSSKSEQTSNLKPSIAGIESIT